MTDQEISILKKRCMDAMGTNANIANHQSTMLQLIHEVEASRKGFNKSHPKAKQEVFEDPPTAVVTEEDELDSSETEATGEESESSSPVWDDEAPAASAKKKPVSKKKAAK